MPSPLTVSVTVTPYGPEESDENPGVYLHRCAEALADAYGYDCQVFVAKPAGELFRQLQVSIPDEGSPGGKRAVMVTAPDIVVDTGGTIEVLTEAAFNAKYGVS